MTARARAEPALRGSEIPEPGAKPSRAAPIARKLEPKKFRWLDLIATHGDFPPVVFRVAYLVRCIFGDNETGRCEAAMDTIAGRLGINERTVRRAIDQLDAAGFIQVTRRGWNHTNVLHPTVPERTEMSAPNDTRDMRDSVSGADIPVTMERTFAVTEMSDALAYVPAEPAGGPDSPPTAGPPRALSSTTRVASRRSTATSRRAPDGAPTRPVHAGMEVDIAELGRCRVITCHPKTRRVTIRVLATNQERTIKVKDDVVFVDRESRDD